ncbi:rho guanine nucleotide exchange factor 12-like isoform X2 [Seriola lalandi dorsalis]|uniref:rho guanine nucleotide exchange factor 12-like isoform X2 n=1 Tax=Seriola lalandi dorsalis TaxID=1841481 RepID=UPI000C6F468D|nr:rho guanine nucleotide exchange factor 12-like isoform X2 [Seriola lalandi dorsalis]XP_056253056.1 rho guanine nucleotide exchange factor 12 isoform X2 [Seriola aureovittata]
MSGTQSTLTDRTPSILNKEPTDKKPKNEKSSVSLKHEFDPTGLVQRCVIIQRDENGFGLTVSGDNPVFVQLVKEDGAAMRAGVQTGDRIIKVNGTLVTHSNHIEVVKLIKSGSYVALTVLGRPPGLPQIPLEEDEKEKGAEVSTPSSLSVPHSPALPGGEHCSPQEHLTSPPPNGEENKGMHSQKIDSLQKMLTKQQLDLQAKEEECGRHPRPKLVKEIQEAKKYISLLQEQINKAIAAIQDGVTVSRNGEAEQGDGEATSSSRGDGGNDRPSTNSNSMHSSPLPESPGKRETPCQSPDVSRRDGLNSCSSPDTEDNTDTDSSAQCIVGSPPYLLHPQIIGAEDDYFDSQQEQINGQCSCFQSIDLLKSRPAHLAVFLHHVVSQFDPVPLLCYLYADMHKQTSSKESRRFFMEFHSLFMDRTANLKVPVPETIASELEKRRLELIPEELCKQYTQVLQDTLLPDLHKNLEDFRQKRSMGLTLAEDELSKMDVERGKDQQALEKECSCAEHIISKIEDILLTSQPSEDEKCQTMQYVLLTYMKHLGVKVKEPRGLEHKRARINFLPKIKKSIKPEKEGEEKVKKPRFPNILGPPRRLSRVDSTSVGKAVELNKQRSPKQLSQPAFGILEQSDSSAANSGSRIRGNQLSEGSDAGAPVLPSPTHSSPIGQASDTSGQDSDSNVSPFSIQPRPGEGLPSGDQQDGVFSPTSTQFDFSPSNLEQLQEEDQEAFRMEVQCAATSGDTQSEDDQGGEVECEEDPLNWQSLVSRGVLASLTPQEIKRQEVINELFYTERAHLRMLKVLDCVFYQRLNRDSILPPEDIKHIFINLEEIIQLHVSITEQMTATRKRSETSVIGQIGDDLLEWFSGEEEEKIKRAVGTFCCNQPSALELIKTKKKKDQRFHLFMQEAESNRLCRRLQLKDIIPVEMQRLTKYPLLLDNIAKYTEDGEERQKVKKAGECCKKILNHVNQAVKEAENKQRLEEYQRRLDLSSLKQSENPMILELKNLDLTKRKMVHEGPLSWKVNKDKAIELYTILLEDILVLLQKQDERLILKFHGKNVASAADTKHIFSPIIKLNTVLVRPVATDNKSFFVLSMSENGAQIYELMAQTVSDQRTWQCLITQRAEAMKAKPHSSGTPPAQSDAERDAIEIINRGIPRPCKDANGTSSGGIHSTGSYKDATCSPDIQAPLAGINPFDGMKSEDEEEEPAVADRREEEEEDEEVDEAELEAFLDGQLADRLPFLQQEGSRRGIAIENQEHNPFGVASSKAEDALQTLAMLKQALFNHMMSREAEEEKEETEDNKQSGAPVCQLSASSPGSPEGASAARDESRASASSQKDDLQLPPGHTGLSETTERNGGFVVLDFSVGSEESSTDDDVGLGGDMGIDMRKLLSSSSQTGGGGGPNLSRQLMTHLRLLQADLQYLKEVEMKYNELRQTHTDAAAADSDDNNDGIQ